MDSGERSGDTDTAAACRPSPCLSPRRPRPRRMPMNTPYPALKWTKLFFLATLIPATILCFFAVGSLEKESAYLEKEFRTQLQNEILAVHAQLNRILMDTHDDLERALTYPKLERTTAQKLYRRYPAVEVVYMTSRERKLTFPPPATKQPKEQAFREWFPAIINDTFAMRPYAKNYRRDLVDKDTIVFSNFVAENRSGIIPLDINGELKLVYWEFRDDGRVTGCLISDDWLRREFAKVIVNPVTENRLLTILDGQARPLKPIKGEEYRDWRQVYLSKEISRTLPNWKIAAYLVNTKMFAERGGRIHRISLAMVLAMGLLIVFGGFLVIQALVQRVNLAQQKASFAAKVSHELKTPLTSIRLFCEMLLKHENPPADKTRRYLGHILFETKRLSKLINNVLDFTALDKKKYRYEMQVFDAAVFLRELIDAQTDRLRVEGFTVDVEIAAGQMPVYGDEAALAQAVVNILSNAEKYSPAEKRITVTVRRDDRWITIDIVDRGVGVPPPLREKIFEEFYRVDERLSARQGGTGLGLAIARRIVEDHNGRLTCHPQQPGTLFRIELPAHRS